MKKKNIKLNNSGVPVSVPLKINIFNKYINNKYKLVPFKTRVNYVGLTTYFPSEFKEWNNNIYYYNFNYIKNLPLYSINLNKLLKNYFDLYLLPKNKKNIIMSLSSKNIRFSLNKIFISKAELKHTSSKLIITIFIFNRERLILIRNLIKLYSLHLKTKLYLENKKFFFECFKGILNKKFKIFNKIKLKFNINNLKFKDIMLFKLSKLLNKFFNKKVEFNIINLNSYTYNSDIIIEVFKKKVIKPDSNLLHIIKFITEKGLNSKFITNDNKHRISKSIDYELIPNKYRNLNINSILKNINFNETIKNIYNINNNTNEDLIYKYIKYKLIGGVRLEIKGRLTRRYRADRARFYSNVEGTLQNVDSSFNGLSSKMYRNNINSNMQYTIDVYKRHVGAYALKGWISGRC